MRSLAAAAALASGGKCKYGTAVFSASKFSLTINSGGTFTKGTGTTTFKKGGTQTWTDSNGTAQDLGAVQVSVAAEGTGGTIANVFSGGGGEYNKTRVLSSKLRFILSTRFLLKIVHTTKISFFTIFSIIITSDYVSNLQYFNNNTFHKPQTDNFKYQLISYNLK